MAVQVFVDDSGGKGHGKHFALVGLVAESESWEAFSVEWAACLAEHPKISMLKMRDAAALRGEFSLWPPRCERRQTSGIGSHHQSLCEVRDLDGH